MQKLGLFKPPHQILRSDFYNLKTLFPEAQEPDTNELVDLIALALTSHGNDHALHIGHLIAFDDRIAKVFTAEQYLIARTQKYSFHVGEWRDAQVPISYRNLIHNSVTLTQ